MDDCIHRLSICAECGGLDIATLNRLEGVRNITLTLGDGTTINCDQLYMGPPPEPCSSPKPPST